MAKKLIIGDIHLDIKNGDANFLIYQDLFFEEELFSKLKNDPEIKTVVFLGDIFTNRQVVNVDVADHAIKIMKTISSYGVEIIILKGNHDIFFKNSYDLNTIDVLFKDRVGINYTYFRDYLIKDDCIYLNWKNNKEEYVELFNSIPNKDKIKHIFGHFDIFNFKLTAYSENKNEGALKKTDFKQYFPNSKVVFSGHYHTPQNDGYILYTGVPYQLSWSEYNLELGSILLDKSKMFFFKFERTMFEQIEIKSMNDISNYDYITEPYNKYFKIIYHDRKLDDSIEEFSKMIKDKGNIVVVVPTHELQGDVEDAVGELTSSVLNEESGVNNDHVQMNLEFIITKYISSLELEEDEKTAFLHDFINKFKQTKMELTHNIELL